MIELMHPAITYSPEALAAVCRRYGIVCLEAFGSAVRDDFDPERSDLDLFVIYDEMPSPPDRPRGFDAVVGVREDLAEVFGLRVELVNVKQVTNPYFLTEALSQRERLYAA
ncbi:MAG: nucleotidyltransferase domain-containing protein [Algisphaera sp.]